MRLGGGSLDVTLIICDAICRPKTFADGQHTDVVVSKIPLASRPGVYDVKIRGGTRGRFILGSHVAIRKCFVEWMKLDAERAIRVVTTEATLQAL